MRDADRSVAVLFRMSPEAKAKLQREAAELDISVQALLERRALGQADAVTRYGAVRPRSHNDNQETLPLTG